MISQIFQRGVIIPEIVHFRQVLCTGPVPRKVVDTFLESSTHVGPIIGYAIYRIFQCGHAWCNNSKYCSISGVFSVLEAPVSDWYSFGILYSWGSIIGYAISRIFQRGVIITKIVAFQACSLYWGHLAKWLIQFWNPLLMGINHRICDFPNFSAWYSNYKDCSISGVFSALGAPRKVVDTIFECS